MKCRAEWQIRVSFAGVFQRHVKAITIATCALDYGHPGRHKGLCRSNQDNTVAEVTW